MITSPETLGIIHFHILKVGLKAVADHEVHAFVGVDDFVIFLS